jgi:hypothetical protein
MEKAGCREERERGGERRNFKKCGVSRSAVIFKKM